MADVFVRDDTLTEDLATWRRDGAVVLDRFFSAAEITPVREDCDTLFAAKRRNEGGLIKTPDGGVGVFEPAQFCNQESLPFSASTAINLIGLNPRLIALAKQAPGVDDARLSRGDVNGGRRAPTRCP